jgi:hypothetical protein
MNVSRWTRNAAAGAVAVLLALTAGCGSAGSGPAGSGAESAGSSPSPSSSSRAAEASLTTNDIGDRLTTAQKKAGSYAFEVTTTVSGQSTTGTGEASVKGEQPAVHTHMDVQGSSMEVILVNGLIYLKSPMLKTDKPWLKVDPNDKTGMGALFGQLGGASDPTRNLAAMFKASKVTNEGSERMAGVDTTHYAVVLPSAALVETMKFPKEMAQLLPPELHYDVWVDGDDLIREFDSTLAVRSVKTSTSITFDHYGEPVSVAAPPASQVTTTSPLG